MVEKGSYQGSVKSAAENAVLLIPVEIAYGCYKKKPTINPLSKNQYNS